MSDVVKETLSAHFQKIVGRAESQKYDRQLTTVMSDVNGTLDSSSLLDAFLCDWHDAGLPVLIATGVSEQDLPFGVVKRLQGDDSARGDWFVEKPFNFKDLNPGMVFDDDPNIFKVINVCGGTGWDIVDAGNFLEAWQNLSDAQKQEALQPFVTLHRQLYLSAEQGDKPTDRAIG